MHILVIYNPVSGINRVEDIKGLLKKKLSQGNYSYHWFETLPLKEQPFDQLFSESYDRVLVAGGDGTIREVASFLYWSNIDIPIGIIPIGSGNLLAQALGIPIISIQKAVSLSLNGKAQYIDIMEINKTHVGLIAAGIGYDTHIMEHTSRRLKRRMGIFAYVWSFIKNFFFYTNHLYRVTAGKERTPMYGKTAMIFNMVPPIALSASHISPTDGLLNLVVFRSHSLLGFIKSALLFMFHKNRDVNTAVTEIKIRQCAIKTKRNKTIQIDGEVFKGKNLQVQIKEKAIQFIYEKEL